MKDIVITSSILILAVFGIRRLAKGRISPILQYALWLIVVLRLLLPVPLWNSSLSVLNFFPDGTGEGRIEADGGGADRDGNIADSGSVSDGGSAFVYEKGSHNVSMSAGGDTEDDRDADEADVPGKYFTYHMREMMAAVIHYLPFVWIAGIVISAVYILFYQIKWTYYLRANRKPLKGMKKYRDVLPVYTLKNLPSPCLSGRNIYLTKEMAADERQLAHILAHEYCHYRHGDSLWIIIRCILVSIYWFHPLVWAAAYASKQDSEIACDAAALRLLGEGERLAYGKTLLRLIAGNPCDWSRVGIVSTMSGGEKGIRERITLIVRKQKYIAAGAVIVIILAAALVVVTFSGKWKEKETVQEADALSAGIERTEDLQQIEKLQQVQEAELAVLEAQLRAEIEQQKQAAVQKAEETARQKKEEVLQELERTITAEAEDISDYMQSYLCPCPDASRISASFGVRVNPVTGEQILHDGVDFAAEKGTDILAAAEGTVYKAGFSADDGNYVILYHSVNGEYTHYRHCEEILVAEGDNVSRGQRIATVGTTGMATGSHLHFAIEKDGEYIEPPFTCNLP